MEKSAADVVLDIMELHRLEDDDILIPPRLPSPPLVSRYPAPPLRPGGRPVPRPRQIDTPPVTEVYLDRRHFRVASDQPDHVREAGKCAWRVSGWPRQMSNTLYLCDREAVDVMVKAVTAQEPSQLGGWAQQQLAAGLLWACAVVDAVPRWKVFTPVHRGSDIDTPDIVQGQFRAQRHLGCDAVNDPELHDSVQTYARVYSSVPGAYFRSCSRFVTANRAFVDLFLGTEKRREGTLLKLDSGTGRMSPSIVVLFVDKVGQEMPEVLRFQAGGVASVDDLHQENPECPSLFFLGQVEGRIHKHVAHPKPNPNQVTLFHSLPRKVRFFILAGVVSGLEYLHEGWMQCVLHRDIKSSNPQCQLEHWAIWFRKCSTHIKPPRKRKCMPSGCCC